VLYAAIMTLILAVLYRDAGRLVPILAGLFVSGPLYLLFGYVLAKFGYSRKTLADLRTPRAAPSSSTPDAPVVRARPAPTRRTSTGPNRSRPKKR